MHSSSPLNENTVSIIWHSVQIHSTKYHLTWPSASGQGEKIGTRITLLSEAIKKARQNIQNSNFQDRGRYQPIKDRNPGEETSPECPQLCLEGLWSVPWGKEIAENPGRPRPSVLRAEYWRVESCTERPGDPRGMGSPQDTDLTYMKTTKDRDTAIQVSLVIFEEMVPGHPQIPKATVAPVLCSWPSISMDGEPNWYLHFTGLATSYRAAGFWNRERKNISSGYKDQKIL